jgi:hypothetical protein
MPYTDYYGARMAIRNRHRGHGTTGDAGRLASSSVYKVFPVKTFNWNGENPSPWPSTTLSARGSIRDDASLKIPAWQS